MQQQITCRKCQKAKDVSEFHAGRLARRDKSCKECVHAYNKEHYANNLDYYKTAGKEWAKNNKHKLCEASKRYASKNKETVAKRQQQWLLNNQEYFSEYRKNNKPLLSSKSAKRRAYKLQATPKWLTEVDFERMANAYKLATIQTKLTGSQWHVDHIYPLQGKEVCGLHVPNNLRAIPWLENVKKGNKLIEESV